MKIVVDCLPRMPRDCLFSEWNCEYGWICKLYKNKDKYGLDSPICKNTEKCPYLREES